MASEAVPKPTGVSGASLYLKGAGFQKNVCGGLYIAYTRNTAFDRGEISPHLEDLPLARLPLARLDRPDVSLI